MTRVTSFGCKRPYVEAGFDPEPEASTSTPSAANPEPQSKESKSLASGIQAALTASKAGLNTSSSGGPVPRKHPKRHRPKKKQKVDQGDDPLPTPTPGGCGVAQGPTAPVKSQAHAAKLAKQDTKPSKKKRREAKISPQEQRRLKRIEEKLAATTCFACREKGHAAKDCPKASTLTSEGDEGAEANPQLRNSVGICYRCGSSKHTLSRCRKPPNPEDPFPFASCFVCSGKGHLAGACPQNKAKGIYPNGGACKICGDTSHLAKDCQIRRNDIAVSAAVGTGKDAGADEDDFMILSRKTKVVEREEQKEERFKRLKEVEEHAPARGLNGVIRPQTLAAKLVKKVVVF